MKSLTLILLFSSLFTFGTLAQSTSNKDGTSQKNVNAPGLAHLVLRVSDINNSLTFYKDYLDMKVQEKAENNGTTRYFLTNTQSHHKLVLMESENLPDTSDRVLQQIAFEVPNHQMLVQYYLRLKAREKVELKDNQISWSIYVYDPDNTKVEIFWDIRKQPFGQQLWNGETKPLSEKVLLKGKP